MNGPLKTQNFCLKNKQLKNCGKFFATVKGLNWNFLYQGCKSASSELTFHRNLTLTVVQEFYFICKETTTCWTAHAFLLCVSSNMFFQFVYRSEHSFATWKK